MKRIPLSTFVIASSQCFMVQMANSSSIRGSQSRDSFASSAAPLLQDFQGESISDWSTTEVKTHELFEQVQRVTKDWNGYDMSINGNGAIVLENDQRVMTININSERYSRRV